MNSYPQKPVVPRPKNVSQGGRNSPHWLGLLVALLFTVVASATVNAANWVAVSRSLISESCPNGAIDPGETNRISFVIKNDTDTVYEEVQVRLRPNSGGVDFVLDPLSAKQTVDKRASITVDFTFRTAGNCGEGFVPTLDIITKNAAGNGAVAFGGDFTFQLGRTVDTDYNFSGGAITLNDFDAAANAQGRANPYPATITTANIPNVTGITGERVSRVRVTLRNFSHPFSKDVSAVVVSPWGRRVLLMRNGGSGAVNGLTLTFDSTVSTTVPLNAPLFTGTFRPTDNHPNAIDADPATVPPALPDIGLADSADLRDFNISSAQANSSSTDFRNPNGQWRLYIQDVQAGPTASASIGSWELQVTTSKIVCCGAGETFPTITQVISGINEPRVQEVTINEDTLFADNDPVPAPSQTSPAVQFVVNDLETAAGSLSVSATSGDQTKIRNSNLRIRGSGATRTIEFRPEPNANGNVPITITVTDASSRSSSVTFNLKITSINDQPSVSEIRGVRVPRGSSTAPIPFTVGDVETAADFLVPTVVSIGNNTAGITPGNVFFGGSGASRTVQVFPAVTGPNGTTGTATIEVQVADLDNGASTRSFVVDFSLAPGQPTITPLANTSTDEDAAKDIGFSVSSTVGTAADSLTINRTSSNQNLLPVGNITLSGSGTERTIRLVPVANQSGTSDVTITVTDPSNGSSSSTTFTLTVNRVNDAPSLSIISDQTISEDSSTGDISFTISDAENTDAGTLTVEVFSDNTTLVPNGSTNLVVTTSGGTRTLRITPAPDQFGRATINVRVTDTGDPTGTPVGGPEAQRPKTTSRFFFLTVNPVNDPPTIAQAQQPGQPVGNFANNETDAPVLVTINEDAVDANNPNGRFVDGDPNKGVIDLTVDLLGITGGAGDEREQTVTLTASVDRTDIIQSVRFDTQNGRDRVKFPTTGTTLIFKPVRNASGTATVTLVLTDNGVGGAGVNVLSTIRKFRIQVNAINDAPTLAVINERTIPRREPSAVPIEPSDLETPRQFLEVVATSSNQSIVQNSKILVDPNRGFLSITPEDTVGTTTINVTITDRGATNTETPSSGADVRPKSVSRFFTLNVSNVLPPSMTLARSQDTVNEDTFANNTIFLGDNIDASTMTVTATSDNLILVPNSNILVGPATDAPVPQGQTDGAQRQLVISPAANETGTANITIRAVDSEGLTVIQTYRLTVIPLEDAPSIAFRTPSESAWTFPANNPPRFTTKEDVNPVRDEKTDSKLIEFTVSDPETPNNITLNVTSRTTDNTADSPVVPRANITIGGTGSTRTLTIVPAANRNGIARITVTATDGAGLNSSASFDLEVRAINDAPTVDQVANISLGEGSSEFTVTLRNISPGPEESGNQVVTDLSVSVKNKGSDPAVNTLLDIITTGSDYVDGSTTYALRLRPRPNASGTAEVSVTLTDNGGTPTTDDKNSTTMRFDVVIGEFNDQPSISFQPNAAVGTFDIQTTQGTPTAVVPFYIFDPEASTDLSRLVVTAQSSNTALVPNDAAHLQLGGSAGSRGIIILPNPGQFGTANITLTVTDLGDAAGGNVKSASIVVRLTVIASDVPSISPIPNQSVPINGFSDLIFFTVNDAQTPPDQLQVFASASSNPTVVPLNPANIQFGGAGANRAMIIKPADNASGSSDITVVVRDSEGKTNSTRFTVSVLGQPPTISSVPNQVLAAGSRSPALPFVVSDKETFAGLLGVIGRSSNQQVVPDSNIFILGSSSNRTVTILAGNTPGVSTISLIVNDSENQRATNTFTVTVSDSNQNPTITDIGAQTTTVGRPTGLINFIVGDAETAAGSLTVTATSGNTTLVPNTGITVLTSQSNPASRSLIITPAASQTGTALITVTVTDAGNKTATRTFALTVRSFVVQNDFNGDGTQDIILQNNEGFLAAWFMSGDDVMSTSFLTPNNVGDRGWGAVGAGDFDADGKADLLFQHTDGSLAVWRLNGVTLTTSSFTTPGNSGSPNWRAVATGDFNKDNKVDILFQNTDGSLALWYMDGVNLSSVATLRPGNAGAGWSVVGTGDVNGDTNLDLFFQHTDGTLAVWYLIGGNNLLLPGLLTPQFPGSPDWRAVGTIDLNGDARPDLLFQNRTDTSIAVWYMNREKLVLGKLLNPSTPGGTWRVVAP